MFGELSSCMQSLLP